VGVDEIEAGGGAPVAEEAGFDVFLAEGFAEKGVVHEVNLPHGKVVGGTPIGVDFAEFFRGKGFGGMGFHDFIVALGREWGVTGGGGTKPKRSHFAGVVLFGISEIGVEKWVRVF
jgi:hypothetical protein